LAPGYGGFSTAFGTSSRPDAVGFRYKMPSHTSATGFSSRYRQYSPEHLLGGHPAGPGEPIKEVVNGRLGCRHRFLPSSDHPMIIRTGTILVESVNDDAPALRKALAGKASPEATRRLSELMDRIDGRAPSAETVCEVRAVVALEAIGSPETRRLLDKLAAGPSGVRLTEEARHRPIRLARRP
jgi:hypothetical protein